jgi:2-hydroxyacyl-CoA lyase 1
MTALRKAKRPLLIFGKGIRWTTDFDQLRTLVEELGLPFITSPMSRGYLPDDHRLCFNMARKAAQAEADVVIVLAARLNWVFRHGADIHREARIFQIDVVADDSPLILSNVERVVSDAGDFLDRLVQRIHVRESEVATAARNQQIAKWHATLETIRSQTVASIEAAATSDQSPMSPYRLMREIRDALPKDVICVTEGNVSMMVAQQVIPALTPVSRLDAGVNGCMGVGLPFAIGAKVACPDRPVVAICGDYGFSLAAVEIETCVRHNIPIVIIVVNNSGNNGVLKHRLYPMDYGERVTMFQSGLRYDDLAASLGAQGYSISHPNELAPALRAAVASQRPVCINAFVDPTTPLPNAWGPQLGAHLSSPSCRSHE